jgi:hypothetical protein
MPKAKERPLDVPALLEQHQNALAAGKASYKLAEKAAVQIATAMKRRPGPIPGTNFVLVDTARKLRTEGVVWKPTAVRRWAIEEA